MKNLLIYIILNVLSLSMVIFIDLLAGIRFSAIIQSIKSVFSTTTFPEYAMMIFFFSIPFFNAMTKAFTKTK